MAADPATRVIGMYVEGVRDGRRFFESLGARPQAHPVVVWKGGMTEAGARATFSHTGSLATRRRYGTRWCGRAGRSALSARCDAGCGRDDRARESGQRPADGTGRDDWRSVGRDHRHLRDGGARSPDPVGVLVRRAQGILQHHRRQLSQSARRGRHDRRRSATRATSTRFSSILDRDPVIDAIVLEVGTGLRAHRWAHA